MEALAQEIVERQPDANIIHINYNLTDFESIMEYRSMEAYVEERYAPNRQNYLFIDEVQMCASFEKAINSLHARERYSIFITGSNAFLQSSDLATLFVGRTYEIPVYPFSFAEYLEYFPSRNIYDSLTAYISDGGMAGSYLYRTEDQKRRYINSEVLNALVVRDIVSKYKLRNEQLLHALIDYLMDNVGNLTSIRSIADTLESSRMKADHKTIGKYVDALCKAFAFYRFRRYDIRGKRYLRSEDKYYLVDQSFRFARLGTKNMDYGRVLENIGCHGTPAPRLRGLRRRPIQEGNRLRRNQAGRETLHPGREQYFRGEDVRARSVSPAGNKGCFPQDTDCAHLSTRIPARGNTNRGHS